MAIQDVLKRIAPGNTAWLWLGLTIVLAILYYEPSVHRRRAESHAAGLAVLMLAQLALSAWRRWE